MKRTSWAGAQEKRSARTGRGQRAFSLAEVLISASVLAVGLLSLLVVVLHGLRAAQVASRQSESLHHARRLIELVRVRNLAFEQFPASPGAESGVGDAAGVRRSLDAPPFAQDLPSGTGLERHIACERVGAAATTYDYELMKVTVTIFYTERGHRRQVRLQALQARP